MPTVDLPRHLLRSVTKPARYVGGEWNSIDKRDLVEDRTANLIRFAFCFPDTYEIGMSNQALRIFYSLLNRRPDTWCERVFAPWTDMEKQMREAHIPLFSLESRTPLSGFDLIGFSLQYELCYTNVLNMLDLGGVPVRAAERRADQPLVIAGGPVAFNLEPVAEFFDLALVGEGEEAISELVDLYQEYKQAGKLDKEAFLRRAAQIAGVYVPSFYDVSYKPDGTVESIRPNQPDIPVVVHKRLIRDLDSLQPPVEDIVPGTQIVHDRIFLEVFRGCPRGCRFCQAGMIYRPVRESSSSRLAEQAARAQDATGYDEVGLLSLSTSDYSDLSRLTDHLLDDLNQRHASLSLPSLRVDSFSLDLMEKASHTRKSGLTFAPEAGTQRLRDVINKNITEEDLFAAMNLAFGGGWNGAKLYFMLGLPTETMEDVEGIAALAHAIERQWQALPRDMRRRRLEMTISTSFFIPKPFTPFQWAGQPSPEVLEQRRLRLSGLLKSRNIKYQWHDLAMTRLEAVMARGDRRLGAVIYAAWRQGCTFDAWDESFDWTVWARCLADAGLDPDFYASRERSEDEVFPWSHIDCGVSAAYLLSEYRLALAGIPTPQCRDGCSACGAECFGCGDCVGERAADRSEAVPVAARSEEKPVSPTETTVLRLRFARQEPAIWLAHLDLMRTFERAVRRARLPVAYSQGFNPRPQLAFALPIGTGLATRDDYVDITFTEPVAPGIVPDLLNRYLPAGLSILAAELAPASPKSLMSQIGAADYLLEAAGIGAAAGRLRAMSAEGSWTVRKGGRRAATEIDIRPLLLDWLEQSENRLIVRVRAGSRDNLRPDLLIEALTAFGGLDPLAAADTAITRLRLLVMADGGWQSPLPMPDEH